MMFKCNKKTLDYLNEINNYFRKIGEEIHYEFTALPLSSEKNEIDDKIELTFHKYIDVNTKFSTKVEEDLEKIKDLILNSSYNRAVYNVSVYGDTHRNFSFTINNPYSQND